MAIDIKTPEGKAHYNSVLATDSYVDGVLTANDVALYQQLAEMPDKSQYQNLARWWRHMQSLPAEKRLLLKMTADAAKAKKEEKKGDDDFDLFGEIDPEEAKAVAAKAKKPAKPQKVVISKSSLVIEVKPESTETDLDALAVAIRAITMEGLTWGASVNKIPIAFGLEKLRCSCVILDDLVNTGELTERIEFIGMNDKQKALKEKINSGEIDEDDLEEGELGGHVSSAEIVSFNKL